MHSEINIIGKCACSVSVHALYYIHSLQYIENDTHSMFVSRQSCITVGCEGLCMNHASYLHVFSNINILFTHMHLEC